MRQEWLWRTLQCHRIDCVARVLASFEPHHPRGQSRFACVNSFAQSECRKVAVLEQVINYPLFPATGIVEKKTSNCGRTAQHVVRRKNCDTAVRSITRHKNLFHVFILQTKAARPSNRRFAGPLPMRLMRKSGRDHPSPLRLLRRGTTRDRAGIISVAGHLGARFWPFMMEAR